MRKHLTTIILILLLLTGLSFLLYPTVSDWWNSLHQSRAIAGYTEAVEGMDEESYEKWWNEAREYNEGLKHKPDRYRMTEQEQGAIIRLFRKYTDLLKTLYRNRMDH